MDFSQRCMDISFCLEYFSHGFCFRDNVGEPASKDSLLVWLSMFFCAHDAPDEHEVCSNRGAMIKNIVGDYDGEHILRLGVE